MSDHDTSLRKTLDSTAREILSRLPDGAAPTIGLVLGSGLGGFADRLEERVSIPYGELPGFPVASVAGHAGNLVYGRISDVETLTLQGRVHGYEGHDLKTLVFPVRVLIAAGCNTLIITNASGGVDDSLTPGQLVVIDDHINLMGASPLTGPNDAELGPRFPDMTEAYDSSLRRLAVTAAAELDLDLRGGIYAGLNGPTYETPSEVRMLRTLGADLAGMSTVPEVIAARHMGARVLGISCVTNLAAGISGEPLSHDEVTSTAEGSRDAFMQLLERILLRLGEQN